MGKGLKSVTTLSAREIAKKHGLSLAYIAKQIAKGVKVEKEHTKSLKQANEIARDHLGERPDYYIKLDKMEKTKVLKELGEYDNKGGSPVVGDLTGSSRKVSKVDEGKVLDKIKKSAKVGALVGALGAHGGKIYDIGNVATHHDDPGLAAATMVANIHPASRVANAMTTALKASKANAGENEFSRQKKYGAKIITKEEQIKEDLRKWFREKWVRYDTKGNIKGPCAREEGEGKPKCRPLASARAMSKDERAKSARRKRREDPVADRPGKGGKPIMVNTNEETLLEKNIPTNPELWARAKAQAKAKFDVYPSAYANGWASKWYKSKGGGWKSAANESIEEACWDTHKQEGMKKKGGKMVPNCVPKEETNDKPAAYTYATERGIYEESDAADETNMAKTQLKAMSSKANNLQSKLKSPKNLPGWVQSKIAVAKDGITAVDDYMTHSNNINEISAELVGKVSNARFWRGEAPSKTLTRAINKKFIESGKKKENVKKQTVKEELMDTKEQIHEAIGNIMEDNLHEMKENFLAVLQEKAIEKLEERKKEIAANYFAQD